MPRSFSIASALGKGKSTQRGSQHAHALDLNAASDPTDWLSTDFAYLKALDASMRCTLCYDIYTAPVVLRECHHTFCSVCIRSHINQPDAKGRFCPQCRQTKVSDGELVPVQGLEEAAEAWRLARVQLVDAAGRLQSLQNGAAEDHDEEEQSVGSSSSAEVERVSAGPRPSSSSAAPRGVKRKLGEARGSSPPLAESSGRRTRQSTSAAAREVTATQQRSSPSSASSPLKVVELKASDITHCPICDREFTLAKLNLHLDKEDCNSPYTEAESTTNTRSSWFVRPNGENSSFRNGGKPPFDGMPKMVRPQYVGKSDRDMKKLLEKEHLPTSGTKERMVARHRQWINLYNANLDAAAAKRQTDVQLRRALSEWDRGKDEEERHRQRGGVVPVDKAKTWAQDHKSEFAQLVEKARSSHHQNKDKTRSMPIVQERDGSEGVNSRRSPPSVGLPAVANEARVGSGSGSGSGSRNRPHVPEPTYEGDWSSGGADGPGSPGSDEDAVPDEDDG